MLEVSVPNVPVVVTVYDPAVVVDVVFTVRVEVTADVPETIAVVGFRLQVAGLVAPEGGVTEQARATFPVNPPEGVTEIVEVPELPAVRVIAPLFERVKFCAAVTFTVTVAVCVIDPDVPVTVRV